MHTTEYEMEMSLFLLKYVQLGLAMAAFKLTSIQLLDGMYAKSRKDECKYTIVAELKELTSSDCEKTKHLI